MRCTKEEVACFVQRFCTESLSYICMIFASAFSCRLNFIQKKMSEQSQNVSRQQLKTDLSSNYNKE